MQDKIKIKVVTYNLKCDSREGFALRLPIAMTRINTEKPDIIGFQEALPVMYSMLKEALSDNYCFVGFGRDADFGGESNCIAFKRGIFELFGFHQFWLSPTPYIPGSRYEEQSGCPRICVMAMLRHRDRIAPFRFYNTHLDHVGEGARVLGMSQVLRGIKADNDEWRQSIILTGDMNAAPDSRAISDALAFGDYPLTDTTASLTHTFHDFGKLSGGCKIDYIFTDKGNTHSAPYIWDDRADGRFISDHYPVAVDIVL